MTKRIISVLMLLIMAVSLCSCDKETVNIKEENGKLVFDKKLELTVWETQGTDYAPAEQPDENVVGDWLVKETNTEVVNIYGNGGGQWDAKLTKLIAGGNLPDIVHCGAGQGPAHFTKLDELKQVWHLTPEMLQKYAPNAWERIPQNLWERMTVNGNILGVPYYLTVTEETQPAASKEEIEFIQNSKVIPHNDMTYLNSQCLWIRDDILKKFYPDAKTYDELVAILNKSDKPIGDELLDIPIKTTEEYIDFMYDIKDLNLKENGKTVYTFGYNGGDNWTALCWLGADMYGYKGHNYTGTWNSEKQEIEIMLTKDILKKAAETQNKMVNDEVIEMESPAHTAALYKEKVLNGQYAIVPVDLAGGAESINAALKQAGKKYRYRPFITQVPAQKGYGAYKNDNAWGEAICFLKTLSEEELIQALNWMDTQFSDKYEEIANWGPKEAKLYTEDENGIRTFKDERFTKYFVENDASALERKETKGLIGSQTTRKNGMFSMAINSWSHWAPSIMLRANKMAPTMASGFKFAADSEHVVTTQYPPCQGWDSIYADIPEVVTFWAERDGWENGFKLALAAEPGQFDAKWDKALKTLTDIVDVEAMEEAMTKIAKQNMP
ncbi:MAG: hypothetical protein IJ454_02095 [Clostridia bacterium]|nr:hypothetical protein [Clostridia bacterium]